MKRIVLATLLASSCGGFRTLKPFKTPDGKLVYETKCYAKLSRCYNQARHTCNGDFSEERNSSHIDNQGFTLNKLIFSCKKD